ncbi:MAG TPA: forespore capture DNA-binding protein RefZ [Virgibacillus sp.]|nr:forespore capture DNA-binding protein RefZ [Virgibacillus sp.]
MHVKVNHSKQKVIDAASLLFFQKGFHGTSVRDIAEEATVNVSLISYYFKGKQGLFEYAIVQYYEEYLNEIELSLQQTESQSIKEQLKRLIYIIIQYKQSKLQLTCTIHREMSLDSIFVREMMVTYLAKENHYLSRLLFDILKPEYKRDKQFLVMQLKGLLITPYILHNEWKYKVIGDYSHDLFVDNYVKSVQNWLDIYTE